MNRLESQVVPPAQNLAAVMAAHRRVWTPPATETSTTATRRGDPSANRFEAEAEVHPAPPNLVAATVETQRPAEERAPTAPSPSATRQSSSMEVSEETIKKDFLKRDYRLTSTGRMDIWISNLQSECRARGFPDPSSDDVDFTQVSSIIRDWTRDLISARVDDHYLGQLLDIRDPREAFLRLLALKRAETNQSLPVARKRFSDLRLSRTERLAPFFEKFERLARDLEVLGEKPSSKEMADRLFTAANEVYPEARSRIINVDGTVALDYLTLKNVYLQEEQFRPAPAQRSATRPTLLAGANVNIKKERCFECGGHGHLKRDCPHLGQKRCYNCLRYGDHLARDCPEPPKTSSMRGKGKGGFGKAGTARGKPPKSANSALSKPNSNSHKGGKKGGSANAALSSHKTKTVPYKKNKGKKKKAAVKKEAPAKT